MKGRIRFIRKKGTYADTMLTILESNHPRGVPTAELARQLFGKDGLEERIKVQRTARILRKWGFRVYGFNGMFCTKPEEMLTVFERNAKLARGVVISTGGAADEIEKLGDPERAVEVRHRFKQMLIELANSLWQKKGVEKIPCES